MTTHNFTIKTQQILQNAQVLANQYENQAIENIHLLHSIFENDNDVVPFILSKIGIPSAVLKQAVERSVQSLPKVKGGESYFSRGAADAISKAQAEAKKNGDDFVAVEHLFLGIFL
ncbi:Clp protease N-terminal domain-containing protein, partial [Arthrospira sp. PCC 8006]|uniref:Clp protease N-terminal domain-containing protein n=1 Tax=Arthrospira sp. PCC 8006 TaxID=1982224 RepID=UPI00396F6855